MLGMASGCDIGLNDVSSKHEQPHAVVSNIKKIGHRTLLAPGDVTVKEDAKRMVEDVSEKFSDLDVESNCSTQLSGCL